MSKNLELNIPTVKKYIEQQSDNTKLYIGCDSDCFKKSDGKWYAQYVSVIVIHKDGKHGAKLFGKIDVERIYQTGKNKQNLRLMTEVYKAAELYLELADCIEDREVEIHLDLNTQEEHDSSVVLQQAVGYIKGVCQITPKVKPDAFAASYAADRLARIRNRKIMEVA